MVTASVLLPRPNGATSTFGPVATGTTLQRTAAKARCRTAFGAHHSRPVPARAVDLPVASVIGRPERACAIIPGPGFRSFRTRVQTA